MKRLSRLHYICVAVAIVGVLYLANPFSRALGSPIDRQRTGTNPASPAGRWQYGELQKDGITFYTDSGKFRELITREQNARLLTDAERTHCKDAPENCVGLALLRRYKQLTNEYEERLKKPDALLDELLDALDEHRSSEPLQPSSNDVPLRELDRAIPIARLKQIPFGDKNALDLCLKKASYKNAGMWSLAGVPFAIGNVLLTPYLERLPLHGAAPDEVDSENAYVFEMYQGRRKAYTATLFESESPTPKSLRLTITHPLPATRRASENDEVQSFVLSGYGLLQENIVEVVVVNADLAKELISGKVHPPSTTPIGLGSRAERFRKSLKELTAKLQRLDEAVEEIDRK